MKDIVETHTWAKILTRLDRMRFGISEIARLYKKEFVSFGFIMVQALELITERLEIKSFCYFAVEIRDLKTETLLKQRSI
jgi:hypothetical protein